MSAGLFVRAFGENFGLVFEFSDEFTVCEPWVPYNSSVWVKSILVDRLFTLRPFGVLL